jgi:hypothetical protein
MASGNTWASQVDLPVPRGPNRKKLPAGGSKNHLNTAISAAIPVFRSPFSHRRPGYGVLGLSGLSIEEGSRQRQPPLPASTRWAPLVMMCALTNALAAQILQQ